MSERIEVAHHPERGRYVVTVDGVEAGFAEYRARAGGTRLDFFHTEIDPAFGGRGLGGTLVSTALEEARAAGRTVIPRCPFVAAWLTRHPDFEGAVEWPPGTGPDAAHTTD